MHGVVLIERPQLGVHAVDILPGRRNHHANGTEKVYTTGKQDFQHVVHARGVGTSEIDQWLKGLQIGQFRGAEFGGPSDGPVAVAVDGVDLTIMSQIPERLCQRPPGHGVSGEPLVEYTDSGLKIRITEILVEVGQVRRHHETLIGQSTVRQATDIEFRIFSHVAFSMPATHEQTDCKVTLFLAGWHHENLLNARQAIQRHRAQAAVIHRHFTPAKDFQTLFGQPFFNRCTTGGSLVLVGVKEHLTHGKEVAWLLAKRRLGSFLQKAIRALDQQATTIAGLSVCSDTTSVGHAGQRLDGSLQQLMTGLALHVGNQTESTVVPEFIGMIQTCHHKRSLT